MNPNKTISDQKHLTLNTKHNNDAETIIIIKTNLNHRVGGFNNFLTMENVTDNKNFIAKLNKDKIAENNIYYEITVKNHSLINHSSLNEIKISEENSTLHGMKIITEKDDKESYLTHWKDKNKIIVVLENKQFINKDNYDKRTFDNYFEQNKLILEQYEKKVLLAQHEFNLEKNNSSQVIKFNEEEKTKILTDQIVTNSELEIEKSIANLAKKTENHHNLPLQTNTNHNNYSIKQNIFDFLHFLGNPKGNFTTTQLINAFYLQFLKKFAPKNSVTNTSYPFLENDIVENQNEIKDEKKTITQEKEKIMTTATSFEQINNKNTFIDTHQEVDKQTINKTTFKQLKVKEPPTSTDMNWDVFDATNDIPQTIAAPSTTTFNEAKIKINFDASVKEIIQQEINTELPQTKPKQHYCQSLTC